MRDFVVYCGPWKNRFIDHRDVVLGVDVPRGAQAHLALIACRTTGLGWGNISRVPVQSHVLAQQLKTMNIDGLRARISIRKSLRDELLSLLGADWMWRAPRDGGENAAAILAAFSSKVSLAVGEVNDWDPIFESDLNEAPEVSTRVGDLFWRHQYTIRSWNDFLKECGELLVRSDWDPYAGFHQRFHVSHSLYRNQCALPALDPPPVLIRTEPVYLDGIDNYPRTVREALNDWDLKGSLVAEIKRIPWPAIQDRVVACARGLGELLEDEDAQHMAAIAFGSQTWLETHNALQLLEEHAVWLATFPNFFEDQDYKREVALSETTNVATLLEIEPDSGPGIKRLLPHFFRIKLKQYLRRHLPIVNFDLASVEQMSFGCRVLYLLEEMPEEIRRGCLQVLLGLNDQQLHALRAWRENDVDREPGMFTLRPEKAREARVDCWQRIGDAAGRWIRIDELSARLRGSEVLSRSDDYEDAISPALAVQACFGSDARVLLSKRPSHDQIGPRVCSLVCAEPVARKVVQAGWDGNPLALPQSLRRAIEGDTGPLVSNSLVLFQSDDAMDADSNDDELLARWP